MKNIVLIILTLMANSSFASFPILNNIKEESVSPGLIAGIPSGFFLVLILGGLLIILWIVALKARMKNKRKK